MRTDHVENVPEVRILHYSIHCVFYYLWTHRFKYLQLTPIDILGLSSYISCGDFQNFGDFLLEVVFFVFEISGDETQIHLAIVLFNFTAEAIAALLLAILNCFDKMFKAVVST